nr:NAC domain-containing protein 78-like [Ipomoea batatas]
MEKRIGDRFQPKDYELLTILLRFVIGMGCHRTNIRHEDLYGEKEPWEIFRWDCNEKHQYFFTQLKRKSKNMKGSRIVRTVGKRPGTWHGQDKGKPIIDKKTGALLGYKRSFLYQNKLEHEQDRQWLLKEFYLNDAVTKTYPNVENAKDFVLCRLRRKKRAGSSEPQEIKDVPVETILRILLQGAADSTATAMENLPTIEEKIDINPTEEEEEGVLTPALQESMQGENNNNGADDSYYCYINPTEEEILAPVLQEPVQPALHESVQGENNNNGGDDDMDLMFDLDILFDDPELLAIQQRLEDVGNGHLQYKEDYKGRKLCSIETSQKK